MVKKNGHAFVLERVTPHVAIRIDGKLYTAANTRIEWERHSLATFVESAREVELEMPGEITERVALQPA